jgi:hypothetical protein
VLENIEMVAKRKRPPAAGMGRRRGVLNRTTVDVRKVLTLFVEHNATKAQALFDRVARKNPAKALELFARLAEFVLPRLSRAEVTLPPAMLPALNGDPIRDAQSAANAYLLVIGQPMADLSALTFEPPVMAPLPVQEGAQQPVETEPLLPYVHVAEPPMEPHAAPLADNVVGIWEHLGK